MSDSMASPSRSNAVARVAITSEAAELLGRLRARHGPLMFHQSGGCCDGSSPMCFPRGEFFVGDDDVLLGLLPDLDPSELDSSTPPGSVLDGLAPVEERSASVGHSSAADDGSELTLPNELTPVWISGPQYDVWKHTQLLLDVVPGRGAGFSLEAPEGVRFLTRSRVFDAAEQSWLDSCPAPRGRNLSHR